MKKLIILLLGMLCALPSIAAIWEKNFCVDGIYYMVISDDEVTVMSSSLGNQPAWAEGMTGILPGYQRNKNIDYAGDIVIPEKVSYDGVEYTVTEIAYGAFAQCKDLKSVVMPNTIRAVGEGAFYDCPSLESIVFSKNVKVLWAHTLNGCPSLKHLDLSNFECIELLVSPKWDYVILPADGICYILHTNEDYKCKYIFPGEHPPYPMVAKINGLGDKGALYLTKCPAMGSNTLFAEFNDIIYDPDAVEHASVSDVEVPKTEVAVNGDVVTAPKAYSVTICDVAGAVVAQLSAGASKSLEVGAYIASSNGSAPVKFIIK